MLIQGEGKNLRPVKCFIREEKVSQGSDSGSRSRSGHKTDQAEVEVQLDDEHSEAEKTSGNGNPFIPGGAISEDGAQILELWRLDRLGQYGNNCQQVKPPPPLSLHSNTYLAQPAGLWISH